MRRDFPALVHAHAQRADHIVVSSAYAAGEVQATARRAARQVTVCAPGAPHWAADVARERGSRRLRARDHLSSARSSRGRTSAACSRRTPGCGQRRADAPPLVIAGGVRDVGPR